MHRLTEEADNLAQMIPFFLREFGAFEMPFGASENLRFFHVKQCGDILPTAVGHDKI